MVDGGRGVGSHPAITNTVAAAATAESTLLYFYQGLKVMPSPASFITHCILRHCKINEGLFYSSSPSSHRIRKQLEKDYPTPCPHVAF